MQKIKLFFQKLIPFLKKRGLKGSFQKISEKLHLSKVRVPIVEMYSFIVDDKEVPFSEKEYLEHKEDEVILLNWIIPEMGKGSGGHLFRIWRILDFTVEFIFI